MNPFISSDIRSEQVLLKKIECCDVPAVYMVGCDFDSLLGQQRKLDVHHMTEMQLQALLFSLANTDP